MKVRMFAIVLNSAILHPHVLFWHFLLLDSLVSCVIMPEVGTLYEVIEGSRAARLYEHMCALVCPHRSLSLCYLSLAKSVKLITSKAAGLDFQAFQAIHEMLSTVLPHCQRHPGFCDKSIECHTKHIKQRGN